MDKLNYIVGVLCFLLLCSCGGLYPDEEINPVDDDRRGSPIEDIDEVRTLSGIFKHCRAGVLAGVPTNEVDILVSILNVKYPPMELRQCVEGELEKTHDFFCKKREELERRKKKARSNYEKSRIDNSLYRLDQVQYRLNDDFAKLASKLGDNRQSIDDRDSSGLKSVFNRWLLGQEVGSWEGIFDSASYSECSSYSDDDDD